MLALARSATLPTSGTNPAIPKQAWPMSRAAERRSAGSATPSSTGTCTVRAVVTGYAYGTWCVQDS